jgi:dihydrolipoamide dehydrogenase
MPYDLVVIGSGPAGYVCAIRAAQLGLKTAVVEKWATYGGTCLNIGCIPSKALLHASELFEEAGHGFSAFGVEVPAPKLNLKAMMAHKDATVKANVDGVAFLFKKNKIDGIRGLGRILSAGKVEVKSDDGSTQTLETKSIVIATGSEVTPLQGVTIDEKRIVSSTGALELSAPPKKLLVIGAGIIGLELGSVWRRLGADVEVIEYLDRILPGIDLETAKQFQRLMEKQGAKFHLSRKVTKAELTKSGVTLTVEPAAGGKAMAMSGDVALVSIGRKPMTEGLGLNEAGINLDERGRVEVDAHFRTNIPGIYAIGDVVRGPMLAHKGEDEGMACAEIIAGKAGHVNYGVIPNVVYTFPEIASVGKNEEELKGQGVAYKAGKFPFTANGRARANRTTEGFVKVLADAATDEVLGVHILGAGASEMIAEAAVLMEFKGSSEDLARTCHAHPTMTEAVKEAALAVEKRAIHI